MNDDEYGENRSTLRAHHIAEWREARGRAVMMRTLIRHGVDDDQALVIADDILSGLRGDLLIPGRFLHPESDR